MTKNKNKNYLVSKEIEDLVDTNQFDDEIGESALDEPLKENKLYCHITGERADMPIDGIVLKYGIKSSPSFASFEYSFNFLILPEFISSFIENMALYDKISLLIDSKEVSKFDISEKEMTKLVIEQDLMPRGYIISVSYQ